MKNILKTAYVISVLFLMHSVTSEGQTTSKLLEALGNDTTNINIESTFDEETGKGNASELLLRTADPDTDLGWLLRANAKNEFFEINFQKENAVNFLQFDFKGSQKIGFQTVSRFGDFNFGDASEARIFLASISSGDDGLNLIHNGIIQNNYSAGSLGLGANDTKFIDIDFIGNIQSDHDFVTSDKFQLRDANGTWSFGISYLDCEGNPAGDPGSVFNEMDFFAFSYNNNIVASIDGEDGSYCSVSDFRKKTNIKSLPSISQKMMLLEPSKYHFIGQGNDQVQSIGFIAQDLEKVFPELVKYTSDADLYTVKYRGFTTLVVQMIKEQVDEIEDCKNKLKLLETELVLLLSE